MFDGSRAAACRAAQRRCQHCNSRSSDAVSEVLLPAGLSPVTAVRRQIDIEYVASIICFLFDQEIQQQYGESILL